MTTGLHLIGDLQDCEFPKSFETKKGLTEVKKMLSSKIKELGLTELGNYYHFFDSNAVTTVICLSESHISFHTWAQEKHTNLDVFVCNYMDDNSQKAREIFNYLVDELFKPGKINRKEIIR